eukprot:220187-Pelagomonas_calceolata.AAC.3
MVCVYFAANQPDSRAVGQPPLVTLLCCGVASCSLRAAGNKAHQAKSLKELMITRHLPIGLLGPQPQPEGQETRHTRQKASKSS